MEGINLTTITGGNHPPERKINMEYKYYMNARPISPGAQPKGFTRFDEKDPGGRWGAVYYPRPLAEQEKQDYELSEEARQ